MDPRFNNIHGHHVHNTQFDNAAGIVAPRRQQSPGLFNMAGRAVAQTVVLASDITNAVTGTVAIVGSVVLGFDSVNHYGTRSGYSQTRHDQWYSQNPCNTNYPSAVNAGLNIRAITNNASDDCATLSAKFPSSETLFSIQVMAIPVLFASAMCIGLATNHIRQKALAFDRWLAS